MAAAGPRGNRRRNRIGVFEVYKRDEVLGQEARKRGSSGAASIAFRLSLSNLKIGEMQLV